MLQHRFSILKKIKIFDWILLFFVIFLPVFIFLFFRRTEEFIEIKVRVTDEEVLYANTLPNRTYVDSFKVGDTEKNELGQVVAEITEIDAFPTSRTTSMAFLTIRVKSLHNQRKGVYALRGKPIIFGEYFKFNFQNAVVEGLVVDYPGYIKPFSEKKIIEVESQIRYDSRQFSDVYGIPTFLAEEIHENDVIKDTQGRIIAKIISKRVVPAKRTVVVNGGGTTLVIDPELKDVFLTLELMVNQTPQGYFLYDQLPVAVNESLPLNFTNYSIYPTILKINDHEEDVTN